ncbi:MAG TPA: carbon storage regulator [Pirellulales bacterium]|nr:carbon storage regulator [Pirellulales bacterium]
MIVISRHEGEAVVVGMELTVTVVRIEGDKVILHIDAPDDASLELGEDLAALPASPGAYD